MMHLVEFYRDDKLVHSRRWDLGLEAAKQHAARMAEPYKATTVRVLDGKRKQLFLFTAPTERLRPPAPPIRD